MSWPGLSQPYWEARNKNTPTDQVVLDVITGEWTMVCHGDITTRCLDTTNKNRLHPCQTAFKVQYIL